MSVPFLSPAGPPYLDLVNVQWRVWDGGKERRQVVWLFEWGLTWGGSCILELQTHCLASVPPSPHYLACTMCWEHPGIGPGELMGASLVLQAHLLIQAAPQKLSFGPPLSYLLSKNPGAFKPPTPTLQPGPGTPQAAGSPSLSH